MKLYQTSPPTAAAEPVLPKPVDALALPPFPVLLRVPNFNNKNDETMMPAVKSLSVVKSPPRPRPAMKPATLVQLAAATLVVLIVSGMATLLHLRPHWFASRLPREALVPQSEELLISPAQLAEPDSTATSSEPTPSLTDIQEIDGAEAAPQAAQLEAVIITEE